MTSLFMVAEADHEKKLHALRERCNKEHIRVNDAKANLKLSSWDTLSQRTALNPTRVK